MILEDFPLFLETPIYFRIKRGPLESPSCSNFTNATEIPQANGAGPGAQCVVPWRGYSGVVSELYSDLGPGDPEISKKVGFFWKGTLITT